MSALGPFQIKLYLDQRNLTPQTDQFQGTFPRARRGVALDILVKIYLNGSIIDDYTNISQIDMTITPVNDVASQLLTKTVVGADLTSPSGSGSNDCHATFSMTAANMTLDMTGANAGDFSKAFNVIFRVLLNSGDYVALGGTTLTLFADGSQALAAQSGQNFRITAANVLNLKNLDTGSNIKLWFEGTDAAPVLKMAVDNT